jgi:Flp pilus assembly pilin Flp
LQGKLKGHKVRIRRCKRDASVGQVTSEYAVVLGAIALVCVVALFVLGTVVNGLFESPDLGPTPQRPFTPPARTTTTRLPTTIEECEHGGWRTFGVFSSEADCKDFVTRQARSRSTPRRLSRRARRGATALAADRPGRGATRDGHREAAPILIVCTPERRATRRVCDQR